ncbi:hypothetical protein, partial [Escherichia coli]|uniref:hypothetical protein n=1 Tax=Escherichia coli TaxID=562 RepID=UPI001965F07D
LIPGDIILVSGTNDHHGFREVKGFVGNQVECYQLGGTNFTGWVPTATHHRRTGYITKNDLSKVAYIWREEGWVSIKKLWDLERAS